MCQYPCTSRLIWERRHQPRDEYALVLSNPGEVARSGLRQMFAYVQASRGLGGKSLNARARTEIERWLNAPSTPLASFAYAKVSDWFLTGKGGEPESQLGFACKRLWACWFRAEPRERLTHPDAGGRVLPDQFENWWKTQSAWQEYEVPEM